MKDAAESTGFDLVITRQFAAPRELVFKAWTEHSRLVQWLCPKDFTVLFGEFDVRAGGAWRSGMQAPDGAQFIMCGTYREIVQPRRLVFTQSWEKNDLEPAVETLVTITLVEQDGKTTMTFAQAGLATAESRESHKGGWTGAFENLANSLAAGK